MISKTCLLISDDPDDHNEFSEAIHNITDDIVLMLISHPPKALEMLKSKLHIPMYIIVDLGIDDIDSFLKGVETDQELNKIHLIVYGEYSDFEKARNNNVTDSFTRDLSFKELREFLKRVLAK